MTGRELPGPPREGHRAAFSGFSLWEPQYGVSWRPAPAAAPSGGSPSSHQPSAGRGRTGGSPGAVGSWGGQSSPAPLGFAALDARRAVPWVLGTPRVGGPGQPGDPHPRGVPPAQGSPCGCSGNRFCPPERPTGSASPSELPWAAAGPSNACQLSPRQCSGTPTGHPGDAGQAAGGRGSWLCAAGSPGCLVQEGEGFSAEMTRAVSPELGTPRAVCRGTKPGMVCARRGLRGAQRAEGLHLRLEASASQAGSALNPSLPPSLARNFSR